VAAVDTTGSEPILKQLLRAMLRKSHVMKSKLQANAKVPLQSDEATPDTMQVRDWQMPEHRCHKTKNPDSKEEHLLREANRQWFDLLKSLTDGDAHLFESEAEIDDTDGVGVDSDNADRNEVPSRDNPSGKENLSDELLNTTIAGSFASPHPVEFVTKGAVRTFAETAVQTDAMETASLATQAENPMLSQPADDTPSSSREHKMCNAGKKNQSSNFMEGQSTLVHGVSGVEHQSQAATERQLTSNGHKTPVDANNNHDCRDFKGEDIVEVLSVLSDDDIGSSESSSLMRDHAPLAHSKPNHAEPLVTRMSMRRQSRKLSLPASVLRELDVHEQNPIRPKLASPATWNTATHDDDGLSQSTTCTAKDLPLLPKSLSDQAEPALAGIFRNQQRRRTLPPALLPGQTFNDPVDPICKRKKLKFRAVPTIDLTEEMGNSLKSLDHLMSSTSSRRTSKLACDSPSRSESRRTSVTCPDEINYASSRDLCKISAGGSPSSTFKGSRSSEEDVSKAIRVFRLATSGSRFWPRSSP